MDLCIQLEIITGENNERANERTNERANERTKDRPNERTNEILCTFIFINTCLVLLPILRSVQKRINYSFNSRVAVYIFMSTSGYDNLCLR